MTDSSGVPTSAEEPTTGSGHREAEGRPSSDASEASSDRAEGASTTRNRPRGSRGGRGRGGSGGSGERDEGGRASSDRDRHAPKADDQEPEMPERLRENRPSAEAAEKALVRKPDTTIDDGGPEDGSGRPRIGDSRPAPAKDDTKDDGAGGDGSDGGGPRRRRRRGGRGRGSGSGSGNGGGGGRGGQQGGRGGDRSPAGPPVEAILDDGPVELDEETLKGRRGRERKGKAVGRYLMVVSKRPEATQIAVLEGRQLTEHFVSRPQDDISQIHGNIYLGRVQNVLPGMEAAFVDIGTPKNAVLYRGDVQYDPEDVEQQSQARIEQILKAKQTILCQVTKNPIGAKGARLTQEVSLPGRFVVLIPNSSTYGISKRLPDAERKRLRSVLDKAKPKQHGIIVRTAAEGVTGEEIERDVRRLAAQWEQIDALAKKSSAPSLLYREPDMAVRVIREEFNKDYRGVVIDDPDLHREVHDYVASISPATADRVEHYDREAEPLSVFERYHVHEQLHRALDRKVWLPSGGSLIIEHTEALTVIDVNTGKNVGSKSLEETVYRNNLEAADEIARQLRLRDIGGIIVIDFIDMEVKGNRADVIKRFRDALARDKTRTQVFDISELGLVEMTRKRIGEGLLESLSTPCPDCDARGVVVDQDLLGSA
jgi:ribonuclease E